MSYGLIAMIIEISGVFLHMRQVILMYDVRKESLLFKITQIINLVTFLVLRIGVLLLMSVLLFYDRILMGPWMFIYMLAVTISVLGFNIVLFYRILQADDVFGLKVCTYEKETEHAHENGHEDVMEW